METTQFGSMSFSIAKPGTKVSSATRPELILNPTFNKFSLNALASNLMKLQNGDFVTILINDQATNINEMYFITKGIGEEAQAKLASVNKAKGYGRVLNFNYSGIYSKMLQGTTDAMELSPEGLEEKGLVAKRVTDGDNVAFTALKKVHFELGEAIEAEIEGEDRTMYPLTNVKFVDYEPRGEAE